MLVHIGVNNLFWGYDLRNNIRQRQVSSVKGQVIYLFFSNTIVDTQHTRERVFAMVTITHRNQLMSVVIC